MTVRDKVVVITGASSGIGKRTAEDLAADGARVCLVARREELLKEIGKGLPDPECHSWFAADVTDRAQIQALVAHVEDTFGRCDVLINNAGFSRGRDFRGTESLPDLESVMATNFFGAAYCTAEFLPLLQASAPSHIVNVASVAGRLAFGNASAYCASKFALVGWTEALYFDLKEQGIHVSLIEPGPIPTEGFTQEGLVGSPVLRFALGTTGDVSAAIRSSIRWKRPERVVPRWYYLLQIPRLVVPPLYRLGIRALAMPNAGNEDNS
jgi:NAD(P)-dependent dehydrogenase (short-subunit alcohol dehydrogenase family)